jgi:hypothetical protein
VVRAMAPLRVTESWPTARQVIVDPGKQATACEGTGTLAPAGTATAAMLSRELAAMAARAIGLILDKR